MQYALVSSFWNKQTNNTKQFQEPNSVFVQAYAPSSTPQKMHNLALNLTQERYKPPNYPIELSQPSLPGSKPDVLVIQVS